MGSGLSRRKLDLLLALAVALLLAAPAAASPLDDAKQAGHLGEQADGYVGVRSDAPESAHELAGRINVERGDRYAEIAAKNDTSPAAVAALAGRKLLERAPSGQWVRDSSGNWRRK
jgi:uncharacterized protein YdbL (DUF1318 family)